VSTHGHSQRFRGDLIRDLDEPVRRYLSHAIGEGARIGAGTQLTMTGQIKVGTWLPFAATERCDATSFVWQARVGWGRARILVVLDSYVEGRGRTSGQLFGRAKLFDQADDNTARSAAGRAALEAAVWAPASLIADPDVDWRADGEDAVVATWSVPPERPAVRLRIDRDGAVKSAVAERWGNAQQREFGYIPCGCEVYAERRFGHLVLASCVTVGWWFGTPRYAPFFRAEIKAASPAT
jgi:hypothetical protein